MAIGGEFETRENGSNKPNPLPSLAASCAHNEMVRRGVNGSSLSEGFKKARLQKRNTPSRFRRIAVRGERKSRLTARNNAVFIVLLLRNASASDSSPA